MKDSGGQGRPAFGRQGRAVPPMAPPQGLCPALPPGARPAVSAVCEPAVHSKSPGLARSVPGLSPSPGHACVHNSHKDGSKTHVRRQGRRWLRAASPYKLEKESLAVLPRPPLQSHLGCSGLAPDHSALRVADPQALEGNGQAEIGAAGVPVSSHGPCTWRGTWRRLWLCCPRVIPGGGGSRAHHRVQMSPETTKENQVQFPDL